ncbi:MAG: Uma2 family endonuclease [Pyrinomonadaceae bacterium]
MQITVEQTLEMPDAVLFVQKVQTALAAENAKRRHFYEIVEENKKMEFINGDMIFHSPVKLQHNNAAGLLYTLLKSFATKHKLGFVGIEKIMISLTRNDYEPDVCFFGNDKAKNFKRKQVQFPAPDFVVEVLSDSTAKIDREIKFQDYAAHGIQEYWIIDPDKETVEQYELQSEKYQLLLKSKDGNIESIVLANFKIPVRAIFDEELNLESLTELLGK